MRRVLPADVRTIVLRTAVKARLQPPRASVIRRSCGRFAGERTALYLLRTAHQTRPTRLLQLRTPTQHYFHLSESAER